MRHKLLFVGLLLYIIQFNAAGQVIDLLDKKLEAVRAANKIRGVRMLVSTKTKVKFVLDTEAFFDTQGKTLKSVRYIPNYFYNYADGKEIENFEYDQKGRLKAYTKKAEYKNAKLNRYLSQIKYEYDDYDNIKYVIYSLADGSVHNKPTSYADTSKLINERSDLGNLVIPKVNTLNAYDSINHQYIFKEYGPNQKVFIKKIIQLDDENRLAQIIIKNHHNTNTSITNFRYDHHGNEIERVEFDKSGRIVDKYFNTFNEKGLLVQTIWSKEKNTLQQVIKYEYDFYDSIESD